MPQSYENTLSSTRTLGDPGGEAYLGDDAGPGAGFNRGDAIGRYLVLERLGAGAMGVVFAAYDPELDRKVAIKVLHARREGDASQARLVREAQALAKVTHPGVVGVHDVGVHQGRVFLAMEYVEGQTLRSYLRDAPPELDARLPILIAAGRGLAAAHAAGLVHRDFKPDNVMISARGEVKVMDFGLARSGAGEAGSADRALGLGLGLESEERLTSRPSSQSGPIDALSSTPSSRLAAVGELTEVGAVIGTPAYMAPEQLSGLAADARSDQFAYAITVYEALYGARPFSGANIGALALAISDGQIDDPPKHHEVPSSLRRVLVRALASDPSERWPDLDSLLAALTEDPQRGTRRRLKLAAGLGAVAVASTLLVWASRGPDEAPACSELVVAVEGEWDEPVRAALAGSLAADPLSAGSVPTVLASLDRFASRWDAANADNCASTKLHESQSARVYDLRAACLRHRRVAFTELVRGLRDDPEARAMAVEASGSLPSVGTCDDVARLELEPELPTDPRTRASVEDLRDEIAAVDALIELRRVQPAIERAQDIVARARALEHPPIAAEAALTLGRALTLGDALAPGVEQLRAAFFTATTAAHPRIQAEAAIALVYTVGYLQQNHSLGREWADHAAAIVSRVDRGGLLEADANHASSVLHDASGNHGASLVAQTRAYELRRALLPASHPDLARSLNSLGLVHHSLGQLELSRADHEQALAMRIGLWGPDHPAVAGSLNNLALTQRDLGDLDGAKRSLERAIEITEGGDGAHNNGLARALTNLADIERRLGALERARTIEDRSLALRRATVGDAHPEVADSIIGLARISRDAGQLDEAEAFARDGLRRLERDFATGHPEIFSAMVVLAEILEVRGDIDGGARLIAQGLSDSHVDDLEPEDLRAAKALLGRAGP